jgi:hypothetical protein
MPAQGILCILKFTLDIFIFLCMDMSGTISYERLQNADTSYERLQMQTRLAISTCTAGFGFAAAVVTCTYARAYERTQAGGPRIKQLSRRRTKIMQFAHTHKNNAICTHTHTHKQRQKHAMSTHRLTGII